MPASETVDFEREFAELVRQLRALPMAAPPEVRSRVRALGEPERRRVFRFPRLSRRTVLLLAPACVAAIVAAAVVHGLVSSSSSQRRAAPQPQVAQGQAPTGAHRRSATGATLLSPSTPAPTPGRYQDYQGSLRVRVKNFDSLGADTAKAMQITSSLGGYVASVQQSTTSGAPGEADLVLRVPVARVQTAMIRLAALGTVLDQHVSIQDLNGVVAAQRQQILALRIEIAKLEAALRQALPVDVRLRLEFQLGNANRNLATVRGVNSTTLREAALSRIELALTTARPLPVKHHRSFLGRTTHGALSFLAGAGAIALAALIVLSPLLVLGLLFAIGVRAYRRREERRLLAAS